MDSYYQLKICISPNDAIIITEKTFNDLKSALEYANKLKENLNVTVEVMHVMVSTVSRYLANIKK